MIDFNPNIPIYTQIMDKLREWIASRLWEPGQRIDAVRELAVRFSVNPNTMQRALSELEREGLLKSERTTGRFVTTDSKMLNTLREDLANKYQSRFVADMQSLGYSGNAILERLEGQVKHE